MAVRAETLRIVSLADRMAELDLTQVVLAKRAGVSRDTISRALQGDPGLRLRTKYRIARALGLEPSQIAW
jgi:DNA-binding XRE family transcriptional regulator